MPLLGFYILTVNGFLKPRFTEIGIFLLQVLFSKKSMCQVMQKKKGKLASQFNVKPQLFIKILHILFYSPESNGIQ